MILNLILAISLLFNVFFTWFMYDYAQDWPNKKEDFDQHMTELYSQIESKKKK